MRNRIKLKVGVLRQAALLIILLNVIVVSPGDTLAARSGGSTGGQDPEVVGGVQLLVGYGVVHRPMNAGDRHVYVLKLTPTQFAQINVEQQGVDVTVKVIAPDGSLYSERDSPNGLYGIETVSIVAQVGGDYRVEIHSDKTLPSGEYTLKVEGPRPISASDEMRVIAERTFTTAQQLRRSASGPATEENSEKYRLAVSKYNDAFGIWSELKDLRGQGYSLLDAGRAYKAQGQLAPALDHLARAQSLLGEARDISGQAFALNETGAAHRDLGKLTDALMSYEAALNLRLDIADRFGQAQLYNNLGFVYSLIGYQPKAVENLQNALVIWREFGLRNSEMNTLINMAKAHAEMGDLESALPEYQTVLAYCNTELDKPDSPLKDSATVLKPYALNGIGLVYDSWADADVAHANYKKARDLFRANNNSQGEADVLDNIGLMQAFWGDPGSALEYFKEALVIREQRNEPKGRGITLSNIGYAYTLQGEYPEALRQLSMALSFSERSRDRRFQAYTLVWMGMAYVASNDPQAALERYEAALAIQQEPDFADRRGQAITLDKIGEAMVLTGNLTEALRKYEMALKRWKAIGDEQGEALTLYGIARLESTRHNLANARDRVEQAIDLVERLRHRVTARQLQLIYFAGRQDLYELAIEVRMQLYELTKSRSDLEAALAISERARARSLIDLLSEVRAEPYKGMAPKDAARRSHLERQISELTQSLLRLRGLGQTESAATVELKLAAQFKEQDELLATAKRSSPSVVASNTALLTPAEVQQLLDEHTLLLQYSLGENRSHLWLVTRTEIQQYVLPDRVRIETAVAELQKALTAYEPPRTGETDRQYLTRVRQAPEQYRTIALELSRMVLGQCWDQLGNKRLIIVADGALQNIPFEALPLPESVSLTQPASTPRFLPTILLNNEVVYLPSASTMALLRTTQRRNFSKTLAVLADPVFDNSDARVRVNDRPPGPQADVSKGKLASSLRDIGDTADEPFALTKLEYSLKEANAIISVAPRGSWMKATGFKANRETATSQALKQFRMVHFATHGIINDRHPELSGVILSMVNERGQQEDGYLTLHDIYNLNLPVSLVVLSACRTGVGKHVKGEGVIGLTRGFMYAGAQRVVVSLWLVDDEATADLMKRFYRHMLGKNKLSASAALRRAKIEMAEANPQWRAPYYWAGFVLQGDWQ